jgi:hypothetical protein
MKHDTNLPAQLPYPLTCICCNLWSVFLHYIFHIFFQLKFKLGPWLFFSHIKIQKSHIIKTHNCESIQRELKHKTISEANKFKRTVQYISYFLFYYTTEWWVHRVSSSTEWMAELTSSRSQGQTSTTRYIK